MQIFIVFILCALATAKVTLQGRCGKKYLQTRSDGIFYNGVVFLTAALLFLTDIPSASLQTRLYAAAFALFTVIFQLCYTSALSNGNVSLTVLIVNLSMLFPVVASILLYHETVTLPRALGIGLIVVTFFLGLDTKGGGRPRRSWLFQALAAALANGAIGITQKIFGASAYHSEKKSFVATSYALAFVITLALHLIARKKEKGACACTKFPVWGFAISAGAILAVFQWLNTYAISVMDGSFLFPVYSGGSILLSTLVGVFFFKDELMTKQKISILLGIVAVALINL